MLRLWGIFPEPFVGVYHANAQHEPFGDVLSRNKYWLINYALSPKDWLWYEPWGKALRENHYWIPQPVITPPLINITNSRLTIENTGQTAQWIDTLLSTTFFPLVDADGKHLYFHHHSPVSSGHPHHHWNSYTFRTQKALATWYLEGVISHGTDWPPFNAGYRPTPLGAAFFSGPGPGIFDFTQHWINARTALALDPDPTGWGLSHLQLRTEDTLATPGGKITNTYFGLANQQHQPPPQNDYPIGKGGYSWPGKLYRVRFPMETLTLHTDSYYAILVTSSPGLLEVAPSWQYDKDDATYPRGLRIFSEDSKETWTTHPNDDHMFAEFGTPPLPKTDPPPPIEHIAPVNIFYTHYPNGLYIVLHTSVPCHLSCYHTDKKPLQHHTSRVVRGLLLPWGSYFCFVAWKQVEQTESGDTLYHTFQIHPWGPLHTKWLTFRGNIANELSPSVGPIFKHWHPGGLPMQVDLRVYWPGDLCHLRLTGSGPPCPDHWKSVTTLPGYPPEWHLVGNTINRWWRYDSYLIERGRLEAIDSIELWEEWKARGGYAYSRVNAFLLRIASTSFIKSARDIFADWRYYSNEYISNPHTGERWTQEDLDNLQVGVGLRHTWSVGWARTGFCNHIFLRVKRGINGIPWPA